MSDTIRDVLLTYGGYCSQQVEASDDDPQFFVAETAINAYILGEVNKLVGDDEKHVDIPEVGNTGKVIKIHLGDTYTHWQLTRNQLRQELRNKASEKWGK
jgi:hypothetical protein